MFRMTKLFSYVFFSMVVNYPLIIEYGLVFPKLLTFIVEEGEMQFFSKRLCVFSQSKVCHNSDIRIINDLCQNKSKIEDLLYIAKTQIHGKEGFPIIITDNAVINDDEGLQFFVGINESFLIDNPAKLHPEPAEIDVIKCKIEQMNENVENPIERVFRAAAMMLEPCIYRYTLDFTLDELFGCIKWVIDTEELLRDSSDISASFVKMLHSWRDDERFTRVVNLDSLEDAIIYKLNTESLDQYILFNEQSIFITDRMFKEIVYKLRKYVPINIIKSSLVKSGVLVADGKSYVTKVSVHIGTELIRPRMLRFARNAIDKPGELSFVDKCVISRGEIDG